MARGGRVGSERTPITPAIIQKNINLRIKRVQRERREPFRPRRRAPRVRWGALRFRAAGGGMGVCQSVHVTPPSVLFPARARDAVQRAPALEVGRQEVAQRGRLDRNFVRQLVDAGLGCRAGARLVLGAGGRPRGRPPPSQAPPAARSRARGRCARALRSAWQAPPRRPWGGMGAGVFMIRLAAGFASWSPPRRARAARTGVGGAPPA